MGNTLSVEAPGGRRRALHKLSKPRTGAHTAAGLSNHHDVADNSRRTSLSRTVSSHQHGSSGPPSWLTDVMTSGPSGSSEGLELARRPSKGLPRRQSSKETRRRQERKSSVDTAIPCQRLLPTRPPPLVTSEECVYPMPGARVSNAEYAPSSRSAPASRRSSVNYNLTSYESKRLLNLMEEPESGSITSEALFQVSERIRRGSLPHVMTDAANLPRDNSDLSLYTPLRRHSLRPAGIATRKPVSPPISPNPRVRASVPSTPSARECLDPPFLRTSWSPRSGDFDWSTERVMTPCEDAYRHIGGYKLGSLRIVNGDPLDSPDAWHKRGQRCDSTRAMAEDDCSPRNSRPELESGTTSSVGSSGSDVYGSCQHSPGSPPSAVSESASPCLGPTVKSASFLPELQLSPFVLSHAAAAVVGGPELTATNTAAAQSSPDDGRELGPTHQIMGMHSGPTTESSFHHASVTSERGRSVDAWPLDNGGTSSADGADPKADFGSCCNPLERSVPPTRSVCKQQWSNIQVPVQTAPEAQLDRNLASWSAPTHGTHDRRGNRVALSLEPEQVQHQPVPQTISHDLAPVRSPSFWPLGSSTPFHLKRLSFTRRKDSIPDSQDVLPPSPASSTGSTTLSVGSTSRRKVSSLRKLLGGAPSSPLAMHGTHSVSEEMVVPAVSDDMEAKLSQHSTSTPFLRKQMQLRSESSRDTLGTIFSVGSAECGRDDKPLVPPLPASVSIQDEMHKMVADGSSSRNGTSFTPVLRPPQPVRRGFANEQLNDHMVVDSNVMDDFASLAQAMSSIPERGGDGVYGVAPVTRVPRSNTLPTPVGQEPAARLQALGHVQQAVYRSQEGRRSPLVVGTPAPMVNMQPTHSVPTTLTHRRTGPFRAPAPLRLPTSHSAPPVEAYGGHVMPSLDGRENGQVYAASGGGPRANGMAPMSRKSSYESMRSTASRGYDPRGLPRDPMPRMVRGEGAASLYRSNSSRSGRSYAQRYQHHDQYTYQPPPPPPMPMPMLPQPQPQPSRTQVRRSMSLSTQYGEQRIPIWEVEHHHADGLATMRPTTSYQQNDYLPTMRPLTSYQQTDYLPTLRPSYSSHQMRERFTQGLASQPSYDMIRPQSSLSTRSSPAMMRPSSRGQMPPIPSRYRAHSARLGPRPLQEFPREPLADLLSMSSDNGRYPTMPGGQGHAYISDPWSGKSMTLTSQNGRYVPAADQDPYRSQSLSGQYTQGPTAPYRVLHSYNSPAFRNIPVRG